MQHDKIYPIRLLPGDDLLNCIEAIIQEKKILAGWIITCAGSLTDYNIRFANQPNGSKGAGHFEIVSLGGTLSPDGSHLHICISDSSGQTTGGHLLEGCKVYTTAEIVIGTSSTVDFQRVNDGSTAWRELQIKKK